MRSENGIPRPFQPNNLAQDVRDLKRELAELKARRNFASLERISAPPSGALELLGSIRATGGGEVAVATDEVDKSGKFYSISAHLANTERYGTTSPSLEFKSNRPALETYVGIRSIFGADIYMEATNSSVSGVVSIDTEGEWPTALMAMTRGSEIAQLGVSPTDAGLYASDGGAQSAVVVSAEGVYLNGSVKVNGAAYGAPQARIQPALNSGWTHYIGFGWNGLWVEQMGKLTIVSGAVARTGAWAKGDTIATLPTQYRPANKVAGVNCELEANGALLIGSPGSGAGSINISYFAA